MTVPITVTTVAKAPKSAVWDVLDDFANIANYTSQVKTSVSTGDLSTGLGAGRQCALAPFGTTQEEIIEYVPGEKMVVRLFDTKKLPVKGSVSTFSLREIDDSSTEITMSINADPKGGVLSGVVGWRLRKALPKGALSLIEDLARAAEETVVAA